MLSEHQNKNANFLRILMTLRALRQSGDITEKEYAAFKSYDTTSSTTLNADANISSWASNSVSWAVAWELLNGGKSVQASECATRSEVAIAIYTFIKRIIR